MTSVEQKVSLVSSLPPNPFEVELSKWKDFLRRVSYKKCVEISVRMNWTSRPEITFTYHSDTDTSGQYKAAPNATLDMQVLFTRELPPFPDSDDYALRIIFDLIVNMERHEAAEWLALDGEAKLNPHRPHNVYLHQPS